MLEHQAIVAQASSDLWVLDMPNQVLREIKCAPPPEALLRAVELGVGAPILADGDIIGERIWGRPISVVRKWGAAICTGFYFVRSTPSAIKIFQRTHFMITTKRQRMPKWQASDQWAINHALDDHVVDWEPGSQQKMKAIDNFATKFSDNNSHIGFTRNHRSKYPPCRSHLFHSHHAPRGICRLSLRLRSRPCTADDRLHARVPTRKSFGRV